MPRYQMNMTVRMSRWIGEGFATNDPVKILAVAGHHYTVRNAAGQFADVTELDLQPDYTPSLFSEHEKIINTLF